MKLYNAMACALCLCVLSGCGSSELKEEGTDTQTGTPEAGAVSIAEPDPEPTPYVPQEKVTYSGSGDDVIFIQPSDTDIWVLTITGNEEGRHFAVKGYDNENNPTELFVNTTDPYAGTVIDPSFLTTTLEITAAGDWTVCLHSVSEMGTISVGETASGTGDTILNVLNFGKTAHIVGNADAHHFAVKSHAYDQNALLVNTTDPYDGTVLIKGSPVLFEVTAQGDWSITLE